RSRERNRSGIIADPTCAVDRLDVPFEVESIRRESDEPLVIVGDCTRTVRPSYGRPRPAISGVNSPRASRILLGCGFLDVPIDGDDTVAFGLQRRPLFLNSARSCSRNGSPSTPTDFSPSFVISVYTRPETVIGPLIPSI